MCLQEREDEPGDAILASIRLGLLPPHYRLVKAKKLLDDVLMCCVCGSIHAFMNCVCIEYRDIYLLILSG